MTDAKRKAKTDWDIYLARTAAHRVLVTGVRTQFEMTNIQPWIERLQECRSIPAIDRLMREFSGSAW